MSLTKKLLLSSAIAVVMTIVFVVWSAVNPPIYYRGILTALIWSGFILASPSMQKDRWRYWALLGAGVIANILLQTAVPMALASLAMAVVYVKKQ